MIGIYFQIQKFDDQFRITDEKARYSRSFVKNFLQLLYRQIAQSTQAVLDVDNTSRSLGAGISILQVISHVGQNFLQLGNILGYRNGIIVGTGTVAVAVSDYKLATPIQHGVSSGQLEYFGGVVNSVQISGPSSYFDIERILRNSSGASITIKELGLQVTSGTAASTSYTHLVIRDVLDVGDYVTVNNNQYLRVVYRIKVTT